MREILAELMTALDQGRDCVFCSVIETRGSTPQKAGASMLVFPDGAQRGTLGGGCVEAEVKQRALRVLGDGGRQPDVLTFHLDDNYGWDDGLICGGRMTILADPLVAGDGDARAYFAGFREYAESGQGCTEAVAGTNTRFSPECCKGPVSSLFIHGTADDTIPIDDGRLARSAALVRDGCDANPLPDDANCVQYSCPAPYAVSYCEWPGGHAVPSWGGAEISRFFGL